MGSKKKNGWVIEKLKANVLFFVGIFIGMIITTLFQVPLDNLIHPPYANISVEAMLQPVVYDDNYHARFFVINKGTMPLSNIIVNYKFECFMNNSKQAEILTNFLKENEDRAFFDVPFTDEMDINCSFSAPAYHEIYSDIKGNKFIKCFNVSRTVCTWCNVTVDVSTKEITTVQKYELLYPFTLGNVSLSVEKKCVTDEEITKFGLKYIGTIVMAVVDFNTPCLRGEDLDWCKEHGYI